jgi:3-isopropylmalate/(R)-2-methylmalate dehydratase small subunit
MGRAFVFSDNIDTDLLAPGHAMKLEPQAMARFCLEAVDPAFASSVRPGDIVAAGRNFGMGSSREQAAISLKLLGVAAVFAQSFARIFYRNAINAGLPVLVLPQANEIASGDEVAFDLKLGRLHNLTSGRQYGFEALPPHLLQLIEDGGLLPNLMKRFGKASA